MNCALTGVMPSCCPSYPLQPKADTLLSPCLGPQELCAVAAAEDGPRSVSCLMSFQSAWGQDQKGEVAGPELRTHRPQGRFPQAAVTHTGSHLLPPTETSGAPISPPSHNTQGSLAAGSRCCPIVSGSRVQESPGLSPVTLDGQGQAGTGASSGPCSFWSALGVPRHPTPPGNPLRAILSVLEGGLANPNASQGSRLPARTQSEFSIFINTVF